MSRFKKKILTALIGSAAILAPGLALADVSWTFNSANCDGATAGTCSGFADSHTYDANTGNDLPRVTVSAWANTANSNMDLQQGKIVRYSGGLGVRNADWNTSPGDAGEGSSPEHAMDNDGRYDLMLFDFGGYEVSLNQLSVGWYEDDADISVLAYTGTGTPNIGGLEYTASNQELTGNGWSHVGNYDVDSFAGDTATFNSTGSVKSSYWIVGAYNRVFGGCASGAGVCQDNDPNWLDHLKVSGLGASGFTPPGGGGGNGVPEPGTLMLMTGACLPLLTRRRRPRLPA